MSDIILSKHVQLKIQIVCQLGSGSGSIGRAFASDTRSPRFESSHREILLNICLLSAVLKRQK